MSTIGDRYVLGAGRSDHDRLKVISDIHDLRTRELLVRAGLTGGHRFVEFGCGLGYVVSWGARRGKDANETDQNTEKVGVTRLTNVGSAAVAGSSVLWTTTKSAVRPPSAE